MIREVLDDLERTEGARGLTRKAGLMEDANFLALIETVARQGYSLHGRGLVLMNSSNPPDVLYIPQAEWPDFCRQMLHIEGDHKLLEMLDVYDPVTTYILFRFAASDDAPDAHGAVATLRMYQSPLTSSA